MEAKTVATVLGFGRAEQGAFRLADIRQLEIRQLLELDLFHFSWPVSLASGNLFMKPLLFTD
jgi:hypothetical protein